MHDTTLLTQRLTRTRRRWGDNDKHWGPFTWGPEKNRHGWGVMLDSGHDESPGCHVRFYVPGGTLLLEIPPIIQPHRKKVYPDWDAATVWRLGRNWYYDESPREYGFNVVDGALHLHYGAQTHSWPGCASKCIFLPWLSWRHVRITHYTAEGQRFRTFWDDIARMERKRSRRAGDLDWRTIDLDYADKLRTVDFRIKDFDGQEIVCKTRIEEREWRLGTGLFAWLSLFVPPKIRRSLDLRFTEETGRRKGSWKGGTIGHSCEIAVGETPETAFRRYCAAHEMTFVGEARA